MSFLKYSLLVLTILCTLKSQGQNVNDCNINVDSLFQSHFLSLDTTTKCDSIKKFVPNNDRAFLFLIGYLSGILVKIHSYSGHPMIDCKDLVNFKIWYNNTRNKIKCESVKRGLLLLQGELTDEVLCELEKLKIK